MAQAFGGPGGQSKEPRVRHAARPEDGEHADRLWAEAIGYGDDGEIGQFFAAELVPDLHAGRVRVDRVGYDVVQGALLFDDAKNGAQFT